jgi:hypothetical protein
MRSDRGRQLSAQALELLNGAIAAGGELGHHRFDPRPPALTLLDDLLRPAMSRGSRLTRVLFGLSSP